MYNRLVNETEFKKAVTRLPFRKVAFFETIGSTNDVVAKWARQGAKGLALAAADEQTRGRGRAGRRWLTPRGSALAFSVLLDTSVSPDPALLGRASGLGALAVCEALEQLYSLLPQIKWPNDVLLNDRKVAGVLAEAHWAGEQLQVLILGIGINVAPSSVPPIEILNFPASSIESELEREIEVDEFLRAVLERLIDWQAKLSSTEFIQAWERRLAYLGKTVLLEIGAEQLIEAQVQSLAPDGGLKLRLSSGELRVFQMGEIQVRPVIDSHSK